LIKHEYIQEWNLDQIQLEAEILNHLNHLNIAKFYEYDREIVVKYPNGEYENSVAIILEFCDGGDLFQFVLGTGRLSENIARSFFIQI
jgi:serine/threonine protein kinase